MFRVEFHTDNAAFEHDSEVPRILTGIADKVEQGQRSGQIRDANGNTVGWWRWDA